MLAEVNVLWLLCEEGGMPIGNRGVTFHTTHNPDAAIFRPDAVSVDHKAVDAGGVARHRPIVGAPDPEQLLVLCDDGIGQ